MRLRRWFLDRLAAATLTILMLAGLLLGLMDGKWLASPDVLWAAGLLAIPPGLLASRFVRRSGVIIGLAIVTGLLFTVVYHSQALPGPEPALREMTAEGRWLSAEAVRQIRGMAQPGVATSASAPPALPEWQAAGERLSLYAWNVQSGWPPQVVRQQLKIGPILLASLLGLFVWVITALTVWVAACRRSVWAALLPLMALLAASAYFTVQGWPYLILSVASGLLLMCDFSQRRLLGRWQADVLPYGLELDQWVWASVIAGTVGAAMLLAVNLTDPETRRWIDDTFFPKQPATVSQGSAIPRSRAGGPALGVMPTQHLLGSGPELSKQTAMFVRTPGIAPAGFYWRAIAYNKYTGHGWVLSVADTTLVETEPLWPEVVEPPEHFALLRQTYRLESSTSQVYAAGRPVRLNQPARGTWLAPQGADLLMVQTVMTQSGYEALSWVPIATQDELRGASTDYPGWVKEGYLGLPDELPGRVAALASKVTAGAVTPYDKALAIQNYLRAYTYTLDLDAPPADRDVADYFLFDLKRGYCDYYATAMAVMARSAGLPARLAMGFATGHYDPDTDTYRVSMADAHSWPEVYFPDYGWIAFEPTSTFPAPARGPAADWVSEAEAVREENIQTFQASSPERAATGPAWALVAVVGGAAGLVITGAAVSAYRRRRRRLGTPQQIIDALYRDLLVGGRRLGISLSAAQTPDEFLQSFLTEIAARAGRAPGWSGDWGTRLARVSREASILVALYKEMAYSPRSPMQPSAETALDSWPGLSRGLWAFWLIGLLAPYR